MKIEKISSKKFEQVSQIEMKNISGGKESSSREVYNGNHSWTYYPDTFDFWSNANGTANPQGTVMDGLQYKAPYTVTLR